MARSMPLATGTRLGPYELGVLIGAGGMGEVYRARDTRLDRTVAVKILLPNVAGHPQSRLRFEREAYAVSRLNHPHICALYDVGHQGGREYLVMECVDGDTLARRLDTGRLPFDQVLACAIDILEALDHAHTHGIVHRDLKPTNVMLTRSGAKLLDFGLAKLRDPGSEATKLLDSGVGHMAERSAAAVPDASTRGQALTEARTILGTFQYMAPEQVEGKGADVRTDIFAFGVVLYELATGRKAFEASSQAGLIGAILLTDPPAMQEIDPAIPPALDRVSPAMPRQRSRGAVAELARSALAPDHDRARRSVPIRGDRDWLSSPRSVGRGDARHGDGNWSGCLERHRVSSKVQREARSLSHRSSGGRPLRLRFYPSLALSPDGTLLVFRSKRRAHLSCSCAA